MASHSKLGKNMGKKKHIPGDSKWPFYPLFGGHLTFGRVTFHHPKKITKNCQVRRLNTWLWPLYTFQPAVGSNKLLGGSSDWNGPQKPQANVLGKPDPANQPECKSADICGNTISHDSSSVPNSSRNTAPTTFPKASLRFSNTFPKHSSPRQF